jgi:hypothetical protein
VVKYLTVSVVSARSKLRMHNRLEVVMHAQSAG